MVTEILIQSFIFKIYSYLYLMIIISLVEVIYVIYMLSFFKTRYSLAHPLTYFDNKILRHPIGKSTYPESKICLFGKIGAYIIAFFIILRLILLRFKNVRLDSIVLFNKMALLAIFIFSLLNFNALIYLIPFFIIEIILIMNRYAVK